MFIGGRSEWNKPSGFKGSTRARVRFSVLNVCYIVPCISEMAGFLQALLAFFLRFLADRYALWRRCFLK